MHTRPLLVAAAALLAACDATDPVAPPSERTLLQAPPLLSSGLTASFTHVILPLHANVQTNLAVVAAEGINEDGWIAGSVEGPYDGAWYTVPRATLWTPSGVLNLGTLPPHSPSQKSWGTDVNDGGTATGWATTAASTAVCCIVRGFRWAQATGMVPLVPPVASDLVATRGHAINVMGHVAGMLTEANGSTRAMLWYDPQTPPVDVAGGDMSAAAHGINDVGDVVGRFSGGAFRWNAQSGFAPLATLTGSASWTVAYAINNLGVAAGFSEGSDGMPHPVRWMPNGQVEDLGLPAGAKWAMARDITKGGHITVTAHYEDPVTGDLTSKLFVWVAGDWFELADVSIGNPNAGRINEKLQVAGTGLTGQTSSTSGIRWDVTLVPVVSTWSFTGFFAPLENLPVVNRAKAGQSIPVKFSLGGYQGLDILAAGYPMSQQIPCDGNAPSDPVESTALPGSSTLSYDAATDRYTYVWKTQFTWGGTCRRLTVRLADGSEHSAHFQFTR